MWTFLWLVTQPFVLANVCVTKGREVYERVEKFVILTPATTWTEQIILCFLVNISFWLTSLQGFEKGIQCSRTHTWKGLHVKIVHKRVGLWGGVSPYKPLLISPPGTPPYCRLIFLTMLVLQINTCSTRRAFFIKHANYWDGEVNSSWNECSS